MTPLYLELTRWQKLPFVWGEIDCVLALADWCMVAGWPDPAAEYRFTYHDRSSCQRETRFITDPVAIVQACCDSVGIPQTSVPVEGDIAVIRLGPNKHLGAVWTNAYGWASKADTGVVFHRLGHEVLRTWGVGYARDVTRTP